MFVKIKDVYQFLNQCHIFKYYEHTFEKITITIPEIHVLSGLLKKEGW